MKNNYLVIGLVIAGLALAGVVYAQNSTDSTSPADNSIPTRPEQLVQTNTNQPMEEPMNQDETNTQSNTIVDIAAGNEDFETLVTAVTQAGLVETLSSEGPFTVFAPTDAAFAKVPQETLDGLLADQEALTDVLTYHVVPGRVMAADVVGLDSAKTVLGQDVHITVNGDSVKINDATVVTTDIEASNGVIHVIDSVLLPQ